MEFLDLGDRCSDPLCQQLDFLPVQCAHCKKTFCKQHYELANHNCNFDITQVNTMPACPICSNTVYVKSFDDTDQVMNRHISSGCKSDLLSGMERQRKQIKRERTKCSLTSCTNTEYDSVVCSLCKKKHCLTHRHPDDHKCKSAAPVSKSHSKHVRKPVPKKHSVATQLLMRLRGNREGKQSNKTGSKKLSLQEKRSASGKKNIEEVDRIYLHVDYPKNAHRVETKEELVFKHAVMWFNKRFTIGRILDEICTVQNVDNRNHKVGEKKLALIKKDSSGECLNFPYDVPAQLLAPSLQNGDRLILTYAA